MMATEYPNKRHRILKACKSCRQLKKKCDGEQPCSYCSRFHHVCQYDMQRTSISHPHTPAPVDSTSGRLGHPVSMSDKENDDRVEHSILDPENARYFDSSSAIAFPRMLGMQLGATKAPRLHSFAWNLGLRSERAPKLPEVTLLVSLEDVHIYANEYFTFINPVFDLLDETEFRRRVSSRWKISVSEAARGYDAVICSVVALGCFCSLKSDDDIENALFTAAKDILESAGLSKPPSIDLTAGWILRAIYLRAASRPHASWMASNIVMHLIESSGICHEISSVAIVYPSPSSAVIDESRALYRRKIFWIGRALHNMFSYEYSRPRINLDSITSARIEPHVSVATRELLHLADLLPESTQSCKDESDVTETRSVIQSLAALTLTGIPLSLFAADMVFAAYRHVRHYITPAASVSDSTIPQILSIGNTALRGIKDQVLDKISTPHSRPSPVTAPWWSLISTPFHYILVLLSIDTPETLVCIPFALQVLQEVATVFNSHLTREAVQNAAMLIRLSQSRKEGDIQALKRALDQHGEDRRLQLQAPAFPGGDPSAEPFLGFGTEGRKTNRRITNNPVHQQSVPMDGSLDRSGDAFAVDGVIDATFENLDIDNLIENWDELCQYLDWT